MIVPEAAHAEFHPAQEEIARLTELLAGRDQQIRALREKLTKPLHQVRLVDP